MQLATAGTSGRTVWPVPNDGGGADRLPQTAGTYALGLWTARRVCLSIGRLGAMSVEPGHYVYVGSAHGRGGLRGRVGRHLRIEKTVRWHIDYLRCVATCRRVWYVADARRWECAWAVALAKTSGAVVPIQRFGSSDCRCAAHLIRLPREPGDDLAGALRRVLARDAKGAFSSISVGTASRLDGSPL